MQPRLEGYATAVLSELDLAARALAAGELADLHATIEARGDLKAALTDTSLSGPVRAAVLRDILSGKVGEPALRLAAFAAITVSGQDTPTAIGDLAHFALLQSRRDEAVPLTLPLLAARRRVAGFADGVLETLAVADFDAIEDDLFRWARTIEANPSLRRVLVDRDAAPGSRQGLTERLLTGKVGGPTLALALYVVEGGRARDVVGTLDYLVDHVARARDWRVARVWTARDLDDGARATLAASLKTVTGHDVELRVADEPDLLSGVLVQVGDLRLDASTRGRLESLRENIAAHSRDLHVTTTE